MKAKEREETNLIIKNLCNQIKNTIALHRIRTSSKATNENAEYAITLLVERAKDLLERLEKHNTIIKSIAEPK